MRPLRAMADNATIMIRAAAIPLLVALGSVAAPSKENWPQWRGPRADGTSAEKDLPSEWGPGKNIRWRAPLDGLGTSTPVVYDERVFVTYQIGSGPIDGRGAEFPEAVAARKNDSPEGRVTLVVAAHHRDDGRLLWEYRFPASEESGDLPAVHPKHNFATPSVVTDGEILYAWMGTGQLKALSLEGELVWERDLGGDRGRFDVLWGHGSSPMLASDSLILLVDHPSAAYLLALDKKSGREKWRIDRGEGLRSYSTPFALSADGRPQLVVNSSHRIESVDPRDGKLLWYAGAPVMLAIGMPVFDEEKGILYATRGYSSGPYVAIRPGGSGDVSSTHVLWRQPTGAAYISSFVLYQGLLYMATENGILSVLDPENGRPLFRERLGGAFTASPVAGDGKVYFLDEAGEAFVLKAGPKPEILAKNPLEERTLGSFAVSGGTIFVRTDRSLIAIRAEERPEPEGALLQP